MLDAFWRRPGITITCTTGLSYIIRPVFKSIIDIEYCIREIFIIELIQSKGRKEFGESQG